MKNKNNIFSKRWIYVMLGISIMLCLGTVYSYSVFRIPLQQYYNVGTAKSGLPYMIALASYSIFMLLVGKYVEKFTPFKIMTFGGMVVSIGWILSSIASNIYILTITYGVIMGAGVGIIYGVPMLVVTKWFPDKKGFVVGLVLAGFGLSPLITAPIASDLIDSYGVIKTFRILGIAFMIIIPILSYFMKYPIIERDNKYTSKTVNNKDINTKRMLKSKSFIGLYINFVFGSMIGLMLIGMTTNIGVELIKLSTEKVALLISIFAIFNGIGRPTFGLIIDVISHKKTILISYALIISASIIMLLAKEGSIILYIIAFSIFWLNLGGWLSIAPITTISLYGNKHYSQNYGVVFTAYGIGAIIGVYASGLLVDIFNNYYSVFYLIIAICLTGIISSLISFKDNN